MADPTLRGDGCPGPECPMCNGEACNLCGAGCWSPGARCQHDVLDRHARAATEAAEALEKR